MKSAALFFGVLVSAVALASAQGYIGRVDTIGGTTYDWWSNSGAVKLLVNSPQFGIHAAWMYSASGTTFPDRNMRYNFYDYATRQWIWIDPDHMWDGQNVFAERTGYGVIDADSTGRVYVVASTASGLVLARDEIPGEGLFDYSDGPAGYHWPDMSIGDDGTHHIAMSSGSELSYTRVDTSGNWDSVRTLASITFPAYAIAAGKTAPLICAAWVDAGHVFYLLSENRGDTWSSAVELDPPPAFGGDTVTRFSLPGLFLFFDSQGRLHIVAAVYPEVHDTAYSNPAEIWHWCPANQPHWAEIHRAGCDPEHQLADVGYNAIYADRPSMGEGNDGRLYVAWEQFDSSNVEPQTNLLRSGIWVSRSQDDGGSWTPGLLVTERNTFSHRFPCVIDRMVSGGPSEDTVCVLYLMDSIAGFYVSPTGSPEGPATHNPVICQFIPSPPDGAREVASDVLRVTNVPTIIRGVLLLPVSPFAIHTSLFDMAGRQVMALRPGANDVSRLSPGVYFVREAQAQAQAQAQAVRKVVVTR
jgi:hypothetical protein